MLSRFARKSRNHARIWFGRVVARSWCWCRSERGRRYAKWRSRRCGAFVRAVGQGQVRKLGRQEDIDRLISRAEEADGSCLEERSFQQALEGPDETTWRCRHAGSHQYRAGFCKYSTQISPTSLCRSDERYNCSKTSTSLL